MYGRRLRNDSTKNMALALSHGSKAREEVLT
jgi:hypothetical protein